MRVFVSGHRGMLGHVVARYLSENGCEVLTSDRRYSALPFDPLVEEIRESGCSWIVNALGKIKQKSSDAQSLFCANAIFPIHLKRRLRADQCLIHASTDCVFSGRTAPYQVNAEPDPEDQYGLSKLIGECVAEAGRAVVIRSSVIGPEVGSSVGLMSWFLHQEAPVNGFLNHRWNGITTLEWAKWCLELITGRHDISHTSLWQVGVQPPVSKFELLELIARIWGHRVQINPVNAASDIDRSLEPTCVRKPLPEQLLELNHWYEGPNRIR